MLRGVVRTLPLLALWRSDDGSAAAALPSWSFAEGAEFKIAAATSGGDAPLPLDAVLTVCFVQLNAEVMLRTRPYSAGAAPWDAR